MEIELRKTTDKDLSFVIAAETDDENRRFITSWSEEKHRVALNDTNIQHLIIESKPNNQRVGFVILAGLRGEHRNIEFMRLVITEKGQGYGKAAVQTVKRHAFEILVAHRLWLDVKEHNTRARRLYENEGFRYEGTLRECLKVPEGFESLVVMSLLEQEYRNAQ
jgi:RimJ/RimL family protein N-acetyltransferase